MNRGGPGLNGSGGIPEATDVLRRLDAVALLQEAKSPRSYRVYVDVVALVSCLFLAVSDVPYLEAAMLAIFVAELYLRWRRVDGALFCGSFALWLARLFQKGTFLHTAQVVVRTLRFVNIDYPWWKFWPIAAFYGCGALILSTTYSDRQSAILRLLAMRPDIEDNDWTWAVWISWTLGCVVFAAVRGSESFRQWEAERKTQLRKARIREVESIAIKLDKGLENIEGGATAPITSSDLLAIQAPESFFEFLNEECTVEQFFAAALSRRAADLSVEPSVPRNQIMKILETISTHHDLTRNVIRKQSRVLSLDINRQDELHAMQIEQAVKYGVCDALASHQGDGDIVKLSFADSNEVEWRQMVSIGGQETLSRRPTYRGRMSGYSTPECRSSLPPSNNETMVIPVKGDVKLSACNRC